MTANKNDLTARDVAPPPSNDTKHAPMEDQAARHRIEDSSTVDTKHDGKTKLQAEKIAKSSSTGPVSAAAVGAVMGPPPPQETQKISRWERWRRDRREARELGAPSRESSRRWKVRNVVS